MEIDVQALLDMETDVQAIFGKDFIYCFVNVSCHLPLYLLPCILPCILAGTKPAFSLRMYRCLRIHVLIQLSFMQVVCLCSIQVQLHAYAGSSCLLM